MTAEPMDRLMEIPSFRDYVTQRNTETEAKAKSQTRLETLAGNLVDYFTARSDTPSADALAIIHECGNAEILNSWLKRAYKGETSKQIFGC